jgi:AcrR family transcriptional regulator
MTNKTEQKILDAGLKVFSKKGYDAATTRGIAEESGFTEMTLFRKFGTKKNLFDQVMIYNVNKLTDEFLQIHDLDHKFKDPKDFLEAFVKRFAKFSLDNIEVFRLSVNEDNIESDGTMGETTNFVGEFIKGNIPDIKVDPKTLGLTITTFVYMINLERYNGRIKHGLYDETLQKFINNILICFETTKQ